MAISPVLVKPTFRLGAAALMISGYTRIDNLTIGSIMSNQYGGYSQYLTMQGLAIAVTTMIIGVVVDLVPFLKFMQTLRRYLFVTAMPLAVVISSIYWTLLLFFPALILAQESSAPGATLSSSGSEPFRLPLSIDFALHACPAISLVIDFFGFETKYSPAEVDFKVPVIVACYAAFYGSWVEFCATKNGGIFPYPFLTHSPLMIRLIIYFGASLLATLGFRFLNRLHPRL